MWLILAVLLLLGVFLVAAFAVARRGAPIPLENPDALFIAGIAVTGVSASLIATVGTGATPIFIVGIVFIGVGARRSRDRSRHQ